MRPSAVRRIVHERAIRLRSIGEPPQKRIERHQVHELPVVSSVVDDERRPSPGLLLKNGT